MSQPWLKFLEDPKVNPTDLSVDEATALMCRLPAHMAGAIAHKSTYPQHCPGGPFFSHSRPHTLFCEMAWCMYGHEKAVLLDWWRRMGFVSDVVVHVCHDRRWSESGRECYPRTGIVRKLTGEQQACVNWLQGHMHPIPVRIENVCPVLVNMQPGQQVCFDARLMDGTPCPCCTGWCCIFPQEYRPPPCHS